MSPIERDSFTSNNDQLIKNVFNKEKIINMLLKILTNKSKNSNI